MHNEISKKQEKGNVSWNNSPSLSLSLRVPENYNGELLIRDGKPSSAVRYHMMTSPLLMYPHGVQPSETTTASSAGKLLLYSTLIFPVPDQRVMDGVTSTTSRATIPKNRLWNTVVLTTITPTLVPLYYPSHLSGCPVPSKHIQNGSAKNHLLYLSYEKYSQDKVALLQRVRCNAGIIFLSSSFLSLLMEIQGHRYIFQWNPVLLSTNWCVFISYTKVLYLKMHSLEDI